MFFSLSINMIFCRRDVSCSSQRKRRWDLIITAGERIYFDECEWGNILGDCNKKMRKILCFISDLNLSDGEGGYGTREGDERERWERMNAEETVKWLSELLKSRLVRTKGQVSEQIRVERSVICTGEENPTWPNKENEKHGWGKRTDANQPSKGRETFPDRGDIKEDETADGENTNPVFKSRSRLFLNYTSWEMFPDDATWRELLSCCSDVLKKLDNPSVSLQPRETVQQGAAATD